MFKLAKEIGVKSNMLWKSGKACDVLVTVLVFFLIYVSDIFMEHTLTLTG